MPYIVFWNIIILNHHDITNHSIILIDSKRLTLIPVNISLCKASNWMGNKMFLSVCKFQIKCFNKIIFCNLPKAYLKILHSSLHIPSYSSCSFFLLRSAILRFILSASSFSRYHFTRYDSTSQTAVEISIATYTTMETLSPIIR